MMRSRLRWLALCLAWPALAACGSDGETKLEPAAPFDDSDEVAVWVNAGSAVGVYANVYQLIAVADGRETYPDPTCPALVDDDVELSVTGDCTDALGTKWTGDALVLRDEAGRLLTLEDFNGVSGAFRLHAVSTSLHEFEAHLVIGDVTTIDYDGSVEGDYDSATVWNGSGHVERQGAVAPIGAVDATTVDEVVDPACMGQPFSGSTTLKAGDDTAVITYDGKRDCDADKKAGLSVNGEDRGAIDGISCAVAFDGAPGGGRASLVLLVLATFGALRRRSRPTTSRAGRQCGAPLARSAKCRCRASAALAPGP